MTQIVPSQPLICQLTVTTEVQRGFSYQILNQPSSIGRSPENQIVIASDSQCSRKHALIEPTTGGFQIKNLSTNNPLLINGEIVDSHVLIHGDIIQIGQTQFKVSLISQNISKSEEPQIMPAIPKSELPSTPPPQATWQQQPRPSYSSNIPPGPPPLRNHSSFFTGKVRFYTIIIVVIGVGLLFFTSGGNKKKNQIELRTAEKIAEEIENTQKAIEGNEELKKKKEAVDSIQYKNAQAYYIRGFRDFKNGQFARAIQSFHASLAIYPNHELAQRYSILAQKRFDEQVQGNMIQARRYRDKVNYQLCKAAASNVMTMLLRDPNNQTFKEAKLLFEECDTKLQGRY